MLHNVLILMSFCGVHERGEAVRAQLFLACGELCEGGEGREGGRGRKE